MVVSCCVPLCRSNTRKKNAVKISFHGFPDDKNLKSEWCLAISRLDNGHLWIPNAASKVCGKHFTKTDFSPLCLIPRLKRDAVPSIFQKYQRAFSSMVVHQPPVSAKSINQKTYDKYNEKSTTFCSNKNSSASTLADLAAAASRASSLPVPVNKSVQLKSNEGISKGSQDDLHNREHVNLKRNTEEPLPKRQKVSSSGTSTESDQLAGKRGLSAKNTNSCENLMANEIDTEIDCPTTSQVTNDTVEQTAKDSVQQSVDAATQTSDQLLETLRQKTLKIKALESKLCRLTEKYARLEMETEETRHSSIKHEQQLRKYNIQQIEDEAGVGDTRAKFLLEQLAVYPKERVHWSEETLQFCALWREKSQIGYQYAIDAGFLKIPSNATVKRYTEKAFTEHEEQTLQNFL